MDAQILGCVTFDESERFERTIEEKTVMRSLPFRFLAACLLGACLMFAPAAYAEPLKVTGFTVGSQTITLTDPFRNGNVPAGAFNLNPPAGEIAYCIDLAQTISFGTLYTDYTKSSLALDGGLTAARKGDIARLFHGFYDTSLLNSTNSAAFQLALWEIVFETDASRDVDSTHGATRGVNYATSPDTPGGVITTANAWLAGLGAFSTDTTGLFTYRSGEHQDQIVYHRTPEPPTWIILCAGLGLVALLARRRVKT
jgi:PEP-CTERM motif